MVLGPSIERGWEALSVLVFCECSGTGKGRPLAANWGCVAVNASVDGSFVFNTVLSQVTDVSGSAVTRNFVNGGDSVSVQCPQTHLHRGEGAPDGH